MRIRTRIERWVRVSRARAVALLLLLAGAGLLLVTRRGGAPQTQVAPASSLLRRFVWPSGVRWLYSVRWDGTSRRTLFGGDEGGDVAARALFDGDVAVRSLGADDEHVYTLVFSLEQVRDYGLELGRAQLIDDRDRQLAAVALAGQEAFVSVDERGVVRKIAYHKDTAASTRELLRQIISMMRVTLAPEGSAGSWTAREPTPNGLAHVRYDDDGDVIRRTRLAYEGVLGGGVGLEEASHRIGSKARIEIEPKGVLRSIEDIEQLDVRQDQIVFNSQWSFTATLRGAEKFALGEVRRGDLDEGSGEEDLARERQRGRDERLSQGWNLGMIEIELLLDGNGKKMDATFVARAAAYARLVPDASDHLAAWFEDPRLGERGKQLTFDVLSATGTDEAQAAMRRALAANETKLSSPLRGALIQRFLFVQRPNPESARFVADVYARARASGDTPVGYAAAVTLGAIVEHMQGSPALAAELDARLRADLAEKRSSGWTTALIRALGNARQPEDLAAIAAFAGDAHPQVREETARSLRRFDDPLASSRLLVLATDKLATVGRAAFKSLRDQSLDDTDWETLARAVETDQTLSNADTALVDLIERRPDSGARGKRILKVVAARTAQTSGTTDLRERVDALLASTDP